ncbi:iron ABC transporter permease [soil metagenome]
MKSKLRPAEILILLPVIYFIVTFILYPLFSLLANSFISDSTSGFSLKVFGDLFSPNVLKASLNSILLSLITVAGGLIVGTSLSLFFYFYKIKNKKLLETLFLIPLALPPIVGVVSFLYLTGENGLIGRLLGLLFKTGNINTGFEGWTAIITVHIYSFYPMFLLFTKAGLSKFDHSLIDASLSLGETRLKTIFKIILPVMITELAGASIVVFMASMASFSAPFIYGGSLRFLTTEIYFTKINGDASLSSALAVLLTIISVIFLFLLRKLRISNEFSLRMKGTIKTITTFTKPGIILKLVLGFLVLIVVSPVLTLVYLSLIPEGSLVRNIFADSLTFVNYQKIFTDISSYNSILNSFNTTIIAVGIVLLLGITSAYFITKRKNKLSGILESIVSLPYGIPGTVIAIGLIIGFSKPGPLTFGEALTGSFLILPIAYAVRNMPVMLQFVSSGFQNIDPSLEEASLTLGASQKRTLFKITLPLVFPAILYGSLLVFINSFGEFVSTILLYTFSTKTISVEIYSMLRLYNTGGSSAFGVLLFLIVFLTLYLTRREQ